MEVRRRWCYCSLCTVVTVLVGVQTVCWLLLAVSATISVLWPGYTPYPILPLSSIRISITVLGVSFLGILSNSVLFAGIKTDMHSLLIPWIVTNSILVLGFFSIGTYFLIFLTRAPTNKDTALAAFSAIPILFSILGFVILILVMKLFIKMKQKKLLVRVASSFRGSRASLNYRTCVRSVASYDGYQDQVMNGMVERYNVGIRKLSENKRFDKSRKPNSNSQNLGSRPGQVYSLYKSRSLEHILDSSTDESLYQEKYTKSLQRIPKRKQKTDTMRSNKSCTSMKSVSIHPRVVEYHYSDAKDAQADNNDKKDVMEDVAMSDYSEGSVPPPIFPKQGNLANMGYYQDFVL